MCTHTSTTLQSLHAISANCTAQCALHDMLVHLESGTAPCAPDVVDQDTDPPGKSIQSRWLAEGIKPHPVCPLQYLSRCICAHACLKCLLEQQTWLACRLDGAWLVTSGPWLVQCCCNERRCKNTSSCSYLSYSRLHETTPAMDVWVSWAGNLLWEVDIASSAACSLQCNATGVTHRFATLRLERVLHMLLLWVS